VTGLRYDTRGAAVFASLKDCVSLVEYERMLEESISEIARGFNFVITTNATDVALCFLEDRPS